MFFCILIIQYHCYFIFIQCHCYLNYNNINEWNRAWINWLWSSQNFFGISDSVHLISNRIIHQIRRTLRFKGTPLKWRTIYRLYRLMMCEDKNLPLSLRLCSGTIDLYMRSIIFWISLHRIVLLFFNRFYIFLDIE